MNEWLNNNKFNYNGLFSDLILVELWLLMTTSFKMLYPCLDLYSKIFCWFSCFFSLSVSFLPTDFKSWWFHATFLILHFTLNDLIYFHSFSCYKEADVADIDFFFPPSFFSEAQFGLQAVYQTVSYFGERSNATFFFFFFWTVFKGIQPHGMPSSG